MLELELSSLPPSLILDKVGGLRLQLGRRGGGRDGGCDIILCLMRGDGGDKSGVNRRRKRRRRRQCGGAPIQGDLQCSVGKEAVWERPFSVNQRSAQGVPPSLLKVRFNDHCILPWVSEKGVRVRWRKTRGKESSTSFRISARPRPRGFFPS